jgi:uncharacterized protein
LIDPIPYGVPSPCIDVCHMDRNYEHCIGCYRTLGEIVRWSAMTNAEKRTVLDALPARRALNPETSDDR